MNYVDEIITLKQDAAKELNYFEILTNEAAENLNKEKILCEESNSVFENSKKAVREKTIKIKETIKLNPEKIKEENGLKIFEEIQDEILISKSFFKLENDEIIIIHIEEYKENGFKNIIHKEENLFFILFNYKEFIDNSITIEKTFYFENGKLFEVCYSDKILADGTREIEKVFYFKNGELDIIHEYVQITADDIYKAEKKFVIKDGELIEIQENTK